MNSDDLTLDSKIIGALPIVNRFSERLGFEELLEKFLPKGRLQKISNARVIILLIKSVLLERNPLYRISEWAAIHEPMLVGLNGAPAKVFCRIRSYLITCRKNGVGPTDALTMLFDKKLPDFVK